MENSAVIRVPEATHKDAKIEATRQGTTIGNYITGLVKEQSMKNFATRFKNMKPEEYDSPIVSLEEFNRALPKLAFKVKLCQEQGVDTRVLQSEIVMLRNELEAMKAEQVSFREEDEHKEKISKTEEFLNNLLEILESQYKNALRFQREAQHQDEFNKAKEIIDQIVNNFKELHSQVVENEHIINLHREAFDNHVIRKHLLDLSSKRV